VPKLEAPVLAEGEVEVEQENRQSSSMLCSSLYVLAACALIARPVLQVLEGRHLQVEQELVRELLEVDVVLLGPIHLHILLLTRA